jgi:Gpi18-like mannosyltransferase
LIVALVVVAAGVRYVGFALVSPDYEAFIRPWAEFIATHGGFSALSEEFANYTMPYLYLLTGMVWLDEHLPVTLLTLVKLVSVGFDAMLAYYAARIAGLRHPGRLIPAFAGIVVALLPTVVLNGSYWAQCDSIYSAFTVAAVYHLLRDRPWTAMVLVGLAFSFKLQTVFFFPVLLVLVLAGRVRWYQLPVVPAVYVLLAVPAWLAGRPFADLMLIYAEQSGQYGSLTLNAPSVYAFVKAAPVVPDSLRSAGILLAVAAVLVLAYTVLARRVALDPPGIVLLATASCILVPFLLPGMHERYFMLAEVLAVVAAFWMPRKLWHLPVLVQFATFLTYLSYLFRSGTSMVDLRFLAVLMFAALVVAAAHLLRLAPTAVSNTIAA